MSTERADAESGPRPIPRRLGHAFPRPATPTVSVERVAVDGICPECDATNLAAYPVLSEGGWWDVVKCQTCLATVAKERGSLFGAYKPLGMLGEPYFIEEN